MIKVPTSIYLNTLDSKEFDFSAFARTHDCVIFIYPKIGEDFSLLSEQLQNTPGMKGCTKQAINYKKFLKDFNDLGFMVVAISSQDIAAQKKCQEETSTGVMVLNDSEFMLERALELPVFSASNGHKFYFRQTLIIKDGKIRRAYIVDDPENDAKNMLEKLKEKDY